MEIDANKKYQWSRDWAHPFAHTDISLIIPELQAIQEIRGKITPQFIVESARNKKSHLHAYFEWDDETAAHKWRLYRASELLEGIDVKVIKDGKPKFISAFEVTSHKFKNTYKQVDTNTAFSDDILISQVLSDLSRIKKKLEDRNLFREAIIRIDDAIGLISVSSIEITEHKLNKLLALAE